MPSSPSPFVRPQGVALSDCLVGRHRAGALVEGTAPARVVSLAGEWLDCAVSHEGGLLSVHEDRAIASGMSASPILATDGTAIGAVSSGSMNPCLQHNLPGWYLDPGPAEVTNEPDPAPG